MPVGAIEMSKLYLKCSTFHKISHPVQGLIVSLVPITFTYKVFVLRPIGSRKGTATSRPEIASIVAGKDLFEGIFCRRGRTLVWAYNEPSPQPLETIYHRWRNPLESRTQSFNLSRSTFRCFSWRTLAKTSRLS